MADRRERVAKRKLKRRGRRRREVLEPELRDLKRVLAVVVDSWFVPGVTVLVESPSNATTDSHEPVRVGDAVKLGFDPFRPVNEHDNVPGDGGLISSPRTAVACRAEHECRSHVDRGNSGHRFRSRAISGPRTVDSPPPGEGIEHSEHVDRNGRAGR